MNSCVVGDNLWQGCLAMFNPSTLNMGVLYCLEDMDVTWSFNFYNFMIYALRGLKHSSFFLIKGGP